MEFRKFISKITAPPANVTRVINIGDGTGQNYGAEYNSSFFDDITVRSCIDTIATQVAMLKPMHVVKKGGKTQVLESNFNYLLQNRPDQFKTSYDFLYKLTYKLYTYGNAFILPQYDDSLNVTALVLLDYSSVEIKPDASGVVQCRFFLKNNQQLTIPFDSVLHVSHFLGDQPILGESSDSVLQPSLKLLYVIKKGIEKLVNNSGAIRGVLKLKGNAGAADFVTKAKDFVRKFFGIESESGGVVVTDQSTEFTPVNSEPKSANILQQQAIRDDVYNYFHVSSAIISGNYTEDQWNAFYKSVVIPIAKKLGQEFTSKLFTSRERGYGNTIVFAAEQMQQLATISEKINMIKELGSLGIITQNEARDLLFMQPLPDGDKRLISLNYVNADRADEYQLNDSKKQDTEDTGKGDE